MKKTGLFPGTFDPVTLGHTDIIKRALKLVDTLYIGIGINATKKAMFPLKQRIKWLEDIFAGNPRIQIAGYEGLTVDFCKQIEAGYIIRGIRTVQDFEYEKAIADMNSRLASEVETIFLCSSAQYAMLASTLVRDVIKNGGPAAPFLPSEVWDDLQNNKEMLV